MLKTIGIALGVSMLIVLLWPSHGGHKLHEMYDQAERLRMNEQYEQAIAVYQESLKESKKSRSHPEIIDEDYETLAMYRIAICYACLASARDDATYYRRTEEVLRQIEPGATVPKHREGIIYLWGHILYGQERYTEASERFRMLLAAFPDSIFVENAWYALGKSMLHLGNMEAAGRAFRRYLDLYPDGNYHDDAREALAEISTELQDAEQQR